MNGGIQGGRRFFHAINASHNLALFPYRSSDENFLCVPSGQTTEGHLWIPGSLLEVNEILASGRSDSSRAQHLDYGWIVLQLVKMRHQANHQRDVWRKASMNMQTLYIVSLTYMVEWIMLPLNQPGVSSSICSGFTILICNIDSGVNSDRENECIISYPDHCIRVKILKTMLLHGWHDWLPPPRLPAFLQVA